MMLGDVKFDLKKKFADHHHQLVTVSCCLRSLFTLSNAADGGALRSSETTLVVNDGILKHFSNKVIEILGNMRRS